MVCCAASSDDKSRVALLSPLWRLPVTWAPLPPASPVGSKADPMGSGRRLRATQSVNPVPLPLPPTPPHLPTKPSAHPPALSDEAGPSTHRPRAAMVKESDGLAAFDHLFAVLHLAGQFRAYL